MCSYRVLHAFHLEIWTDTLHIWGLEKRGWSECPLCSVVYNRDLSFCNGLSNSYFFLLVVARNGRASTRIPCQARHFIAFCFSRPSFLCSILGVCWLQSLFGLCGSWAHLQGCLACSLCWVLAVLLSQGPALNHESIIQGLVNIYLLLNVSMINFFYVATIFTQWSWSSNEDY